MCMPERPHRTLLAASVLAGVLSLAGCSNHPELKKLETVRVRGRITLDGKPIPQGRGSVSLIWIGGDTGVDNWRATGLLDEDGRYDVITTLGLSYDCSDLLAAKRGAPPGPYQVEVRLYKPSDGPPQHSLIPDRYTDRHTSQLRLEVVSEPRPGSYDFDLKSHR